MATTQLSAAVNITEQDFSVIASTIGLTRLGIVGLSLSGPAFTPTKVTTQAQYNAIFGGTNPSFQLPYVANSFLTQGSYLTVTRVLGNNGFTNSSAFIIQASGGTYDKVPLCVIRSKSFDGGTTWLAPDANSVKIGPVTGLLNSFILSGTSGPLTALTLSSITVSLDETQSNYIVNVIGKNPIKGTSDLGIYVESIYPHFIREAASRGDITTLNTAVTYTTTVDYTNYSTGYQVPTTPYVVSQVVGGVTRNLFSFTSIPAGNAANTEFKISIQNIDVITNFFDVVIRDYHDTDASPVVLESYGAVTMDSNALNYLAIRIGTTDGAYPQVSNYVSVNIDDNAPILCPGGFAGYNIRGISGGTYSPNIYYKTSYLSGDSVYKTFLGISELGYTAHTNSVVAQNLSIQSLEDDLWDYPGATPTGFTTIKGFHLETAAPSSTYILGQFSVLSAYTKQQAKFTLVPSGGFDGWNQYGAPTFTTAAADAQNVVALKAGIDTMKDPETVDMNVFATPGINYLNNMASVKYAINMVEARADALYIIDSPRETVGQTKGLAVVAVSDLNAAGIDSSYSCTYWPWLQYNDTNINQYVYIPVTAEMCRVLALTDNTSQPWFAPAGFNRGQLSNLIIRTDIRLNQADRDVLYSGRINPILTQTTQGIFVWGQKTLQVKDSLLNRINIRRLLLQAERLVKFAAMTLLFEQNDQTVRDQFLQKVQPILQQIQNQRGLFAFKILLDPYNPAIPNTMNGKIQLQPTPALETISLQFQILPTSVTFG
jgi:hypothetical protein